MGKRKGFVLFESYIDKNKKIYEIGQQSSITGTEEVVIITRCDCGYEVDGTILSLHQKTIWCNALLACGKEVEIPAQIAKRAFEEYRKLLDRVHEKRAEAGGPRGAIPI